MNIDVAKSLKSLLEKHIMAIEIAKAAVTGENK